MRTARIEDAGDRARLDGVAARAGGQATGEPALAALDEPRLCLLSLVLLTCQR
jgi:hypothetical protein